MDGLRERAGNRCELCGQLEGLAPHTVEGGHGDDLDRTLLACELCGQALSAAGDLASSHWYCLQEAVWSEVPVVQVISYRLLHRLPDQPWAAELLEQVRGAAGGGRGPVAVLDDRHAGAGHDERGHRGDVDGVGAVAAGGPASSDAARQGHGGGNGSWPSSPPLLLLLLGKVSRW